MPSSQQPSRSPRTDSSAPSTVTARSTPTCERHYRRVRDRLPECAPILLDQAEQLPYSDWAQFVDRFAALAGHIRRIVVDAAGVAVDMGRRRRLFEGPRSRRATNGHTYTIRADGTIMLPVGVRSPTFPNEDDPDDIEHMTKLARERAAALLAA